MPAVTSVQFSDRGDRLFRAAQFEDAEAAYLQAIELDRTNIRAQLGVARIADMMFDPHRAARYYSAAYQINPLDPDAILGYANNVDDARARLTLFENFLSVSRDARAEDVKARILIADRLGGHAAVVEDPKRVYRIPLENTASGPILHARINRSRDLRLLVDTGASGITLNAIAASKLRLDYLTDAALTGFGSGAPAPARMMRAESFESGALMIPNLAVKVVQSELIPGADGVIGPDLFHDFRIRLNFPARYMELVPFDGPDARAETDASSCIGCRRALRIGHLLLMQGAVDGRAGGYFIVDSGSPCSLVSSKVVFDEGASTEFSGVQGKQDIRALGRSITIRIGSRSLVETTPAKFDNSGLSARYGTEITGAIGYSLLRNLALSIDYRTGVVRFERP
ncbi:MAG TPA: aspartyl protease family protein [Bryobacteraceae bacterium]